jgi:3-methyladenine DNA glycosylase AlkD
MVSPSFPASTSREVVDELRRLSNSAELAKLRKRLPAGDEAFGLRMGDLFDVAKRHRQLPLAEVETLLDHPAYEPRLTAFCILDFKARGRLDADRRRELYEVYLRRHDRITSWDMVDRAAPHVVGGHLAGRSMQPLHDLAGGSSLQRRTAITAPLYFIGHGSDADLAGGFALADRLALDPDPVVHNAVGIFVKHAGGRDPEALATFLGRYAEAMPRPGLRLAIEKLPADERRRYLRSARR